MIAFPFPSSEQRRSFAALLSPTVIIYQWPWPCPWPSYLHLFLSIKPLYVCADLIWHIAFVPPRSNCFARSPFHLFLFINTVRILLSAPSSPHYAQYFCKRTKKTQCPLLVVLLFLKVDGAPGLLGVGGQFLPHAEHRLLLLRRVQLPQKCSRWKSLV
jgi:hypothetical protein